MSEKASHSPKDEGMTRRDFLKTVGAGVAGYAIGKTGEGIADLATGQPEIKRQEMVGRIVAFSEKTEETVPAGAGYVYFFQKSGWSEYPKEAYRDALIVANKETHPNIDINDLKESGAITVLSRLDSTE